MDSTSLEIDYWLVQILKFDSICECSKSFSDEVELTPITTIVLFNREIEIR